MKHVVLNIFTITKQTNIVHMFFFLTKRMNNDVISAFQKVFRFLHKLLLNVHMLKKCVQRRKNKKILLKEVRKYIYLEIKGMSCLLLIVKYTLIWMIVLNKCRVGIIQ